jgi:hypothetical protein
MLACTLEMISRYSCAATWLCLSMLNDVVVDRSCSRVASLSDGFVALLSALALLSWLTMPSTTLSAKLLVCCYWLVCEAPCVHSLKNADHTHTCSSHMYMRACRYMPTASVRDPTITALVKHIWTIREDREKRRLSVVKQTAEYRACERRLNGWEKLLEEAVKDILGALRTFKGHG